MNHIPAISICIPAYKNIAFLKRLIDSISVQTFTDFEVIITDDSPDDSVKDFINCYPSNLNISYYHNQPALGTPENWNAAIRQARGEWIKLMHNDDWFEDNETLQIFYETAQKYPAISFFFSAFQNVTESNGQKQVVRCNFFDRIFLKLTPLHLFKRVYVGNPSCTFIRRDIGLLYDNRFKFVVDFEYYIRVIRKLGEYKYIDNVLLNIGFHEEQVTKYTFLVPEVQIPENITLLKQMGLKILFNLFVYDYYWRMFRNLKIRKLEQIRQYYSGETPLLLKGIIVFQSKIPYSILQIGILSKAFMMISYWGSLFKKH